ncbi:MAG: hypothetical protein ACT4P7_03100 [Gemmatimonadaceae bacterium]
MKATDARPRAGQGWGDRVPGTAARLVLVALLTSCIQYIQPPTEATPAQRLAEAESLYGDARDLYFQVAVTEANGTGRSTRGIPLEELVRSYEALRERAIERLDALDSARFGAEDQRAITVMRANLAPVSSRQHRREHRVCNYSVADAAQSGFSALSDPVYACYGYQATHVVTSTDTVDRLTVLSRLGTEPSAAKRRALFLSLRPVWESVNGSNMPASPYRELVRLSADQWRRSGSPVDAAARSLGLDPLSVERVLIAMLDAWRRQMSDDLTEPWDWYYENESASRRLSNRIPLGELERINETYFAAFGASPRTLGVRYDLVPREGKTPVAFTQFGGLPRRTRDGPRGADPWVFATYREGGLGSLVELLHESGHAIHIGAVDTRPAFADWPDSDPFTEGLADVPAGEAYEGIWQQKYLGDSVTTAESLRERYSAVMMDVAWALFELRMHQDPGRDPNVTWTDITRTYLRIAPHPEWSWWAMRGQLVSSPGYLMNYALGAMVAADVRERVRAKRGGFTTSGATLYDWLSDALYQFGQSKPSREVLEQFLGRRVGPESVVRELERMRRS